MPTSPAFTAAPMSLAPRLAPCLAPPLVSPSRRARTAQTRMLGPLPLPGGGSGLFRSEIVRQEVMALERDHKALAEMGAKYGKFDREGKVSYVEEMERVVDRWLVLLKRFELDDSFEAKAYVSQLRAALAAQGMTIESLTENARMSFRRMREEAEREM